MGLTTQSWTLGIWSLCSVVGGTVEAAGGPTQVTTQSLRRAEGRGVVVACHLLGSALNFPVTAFASVYLLFEKGHTCMELCGHSRMK